MKKVTLLLGVIIIMASACKVQQGATATTRTYEVLPDKETKIVKGSFNRALLESDTTYKWFKENMKWGNADASAVQALQKNGSKVHFVVFGGTWCHDTQNLLPVFYRLLDKSNLGDTAVTLIGVDRAKHDLSGLATAFHITNVPTFIVMKDGKEVGRVIEYGKYGAIDKEIGEIVASVAQ